MATRSIGTGAGGNCTATLQVVVQYGGGPFGAQSFVLDILQNANATADARTVALANGDNTITVPATASGAVLLAPATNAVAWKTIGAAAGTGIAQCLTGMEILTFPASPPASFIINAGGAIAGFQIIFF